MRERGCAASALRLLTLTPHADNWKLKTPEFQKSFIESHLADVAASIKGKPVILEEFGKITEDAAQTVRNQYFATAQAVAEDNAKSGGPLMGTLFWHWYDEGMGPGQYGGAWPAAVHGGVGAAPPDARLRRSAQERQHVEPHHAPRGLHELALRQEPQHVPRVMRPCARVLPGRRPAAASAQNIVLSC